MDLQTARSTTIGSPSPPQKKNPEQRSKNRALLCRKDFQISISFMGGNEKFCSVPCPFWASQRTSRLVLFLLEPFFTPKRMTRTIFLMRLQSQKRNQLWPTDVTSSYRSFHRKTVKQMITSCKPEISVWNVGYAAAVALLHTNTHLLTKMFGNNRHEPGG